MDEVKPLRLSFTRRGNTDYDSILDWLAARDEDAAERFGTIFGQIVADLCQSVVAEIVQRGRPFAQPDPEVSLAFSRPVYKYRIELSRRRQRRSSSGVWFVFYALTDNDGDGTVDTVQRRCNPAWSSGPSLEYRS